MMKRELQEDNWNFALYSVGGMKIISVVFHNSFTRVRDKKIA